jgi:transcriptional regulator with XRE-family HTH domain
LTSSILSFGNTIRWRRESRRIGLRALARATRLSPSYLSRIERNRVPPPSPDVIGRLAEALNADAEDLLTTAGIVPDSVLGFLRRRPGVAARILSLLGELNEDEIVELVNDLQRRSAVSLSTAL